MKIFLGLLVCASAVVCQNFNGGDSSWYCGILSNEDCMNHIVEYKCGTNGVTYRNMCALGKAHCADNTVNQAYEGPCSTATTTSAPTTTTASPTSGPVGSGSTTRSPEQVIHGSEVILDFQCVLLSHQTCTHSINEKICGTDGRTYEDFCEYEKARCTHRDLHVAKLGDCNA